MVAVRFVIILLVALSLSACGFHLRDAAELPPQMAKTQLVVDDKDSVLARRLVMLLEQEGVEFVNGNQATAVLEISTNRVVTEVLTIGNNARVQEYRVSHTVEFRLLDDQGVELLAPQTLQQAREISFDEQKILATSREQEYLKKDLADTISRMMVTRLSTVSG